MATSPSLFLVVTLTVLLAPGPSALFAFTRSLERGPRAGLMAVAGLETGLLVHVVGVTLGVSGVVAAAPGVLAVVRIGGAGYLALLGVQELVGAFRRPATGTAATAGPDRDFVGGLLVDLTNPKTLLFCLAFLPQFVDPAHGAVGVQSLTLGLVVVGLAAICDGGYAATALVLRRHRAMGGLSRGVHCASGGAFIGLAVLAGLS